MMEVRRRQILTFGRFGGNQERRFVLVRWVDRSGRSRSGASCDQKWNAWRRCCHIPNLVGELSQQFEDGLTRRGLTLVVALWGPAYRKRPASIRHCPA